MNWFERWRQRQSELANGVDADLVQDNQKRYRIGFGLIAVGLAVGLLASKVQLPWTIRSVVTTIATLSLLAGFLLTAWARQESAFLRKPEPEKPPKILE